jgi:hypothetical protein
MNSRDANFDLMLQETLKATAAEAAAQDGTGSVTGNGSLNGREDLEEESAIGAKKRKRTDDDAYVVDYMRSVHLQILGILAC